MNNLNGCTFSWVYQRYLSWFTDHAKPDAVPRLEEELAETYFYNEDVFDDGHILLNRIVYFVPLNALEAKSGRHEMFGFTELNLMEEDSSGDVERVVPVEYALI